MTLSQLCKSYGFKGTKDVADRLGVTPRTLQIKFNDDKRREIELIPAIERLRKVQK